MEYRTLGASELRVSCLALGGNIFGHFCNREETKQIIDAAGDFGLNFIDTTDVYSEGISEEFIGSAIRNSRERWVIATKPGIRSGESPKGKAQPDLLTQRLEASLRRLKTDYVDLYGLHHFDDATPLEEILTTLDRFVREGKVRSLAVSNFSADELKRCVQLTSDLSLRPVVAAENHYHLLKRDIERDVIPFCGDEKVGLMVYGALARGILAGKYRPGQEIPEDSRAARSASVRADLTREVLETVEVLIRFCEGRGRSILELVSAWTLRRNEVTSMVIGMRNVEQLRSNVFSLDWKLSEEELNELHEIVGEPARFQSVTLGSF